MKIRIGKWVGKLVVLSLFLYASVGFCASVCVTNKSGQTIQVWATSSQNYSESSQVLVYFSLQGCVVLNAGYTNIVSINTISVPAVNIFSHKIECNDGGGCTWSSTGRSPSKGSSNPYVVLGDEESNLKLTLTCPLC